MPGNYRKEPPLPQPKPVGAEEMAKIAKEKAESLSNFLEHVDWKKFGKHFCIIWGIFLFCVASLLTTITGILRLLSDH